MEIRQAVGPGQSPSEYGQCETAPSQYSDSHGVDHGPPVVCAVVGGAGQRFAPQHSAEDLLSLEGGGDEVAYRGGHLSRAQSSGDFLIERFLEAVQVRGFRGVGPTATVPLQPNTA